MVLIYERNYPTQLIGIEGSYYTKRIIPHVIFIEMKLDYDKK